jgi:hypothetical protein
VVGRYQAVRLAGILAELQARDGRLDLAVDRLADALDPVGAG